TESLTLATFTPEQIDELYGQHTAETGQRFQDAALERVSYWTGGQPWLVNAIARECVEKICGKDFAREVTADMVDQAAYDIILRRDVHIDSLLARLCEPRVQRIVQPVITGEGFTGTNLDDDLQYVLDMGLLKHDEEKRLVPANRIYAEVFLRTLSLDYQAKAQYDIPAPPWIQDDGLDMNGLLKGFQAFWRENSEMFTAQKHDYPEALPHLVLMGFLQRVVNGGGRIVRDASLGRRRLDILVEFRKGRYPIEVKLAGNSSRQEALKQLADYVDKCGQGTGWLVTCDRTPGKSWKARLTWKTVKQDGKTLHLVGI
ncbi:MAG: hypothetical protein J6866_07500, partial [Victivallales bacterium]|nr:hypothetical protein [Victivallales bacterium]